MDTVRVIHDREGRSLTVWLDDPEREHSSSADEYGVIVMKDRTHRVIGVEILNYDGDPGAVSLAAETAQRAARRD
jgi:hypothetical protein